MLPAIRVENLGKRYQVRSGSGSYRTLRERLTELAVRPFRRRSPAAAKNADDFWALQDVNFEVHPGEVVGIIGRNGAGKSTLLKILSRITRPTTGEVRLNGRVGSLLEVGTGFHPELTGRENIYLNGAILGMKRAEITGKFDEIVAFAEIDRFLDTPVKRYSSGMYVRLAFAVAAHMDPEILIVDEVLSVGDGEFQKKCLGKMEKAAGQGRAVIFVTHNMPLVLRFCQQAIFLEGGQISHRSDAASVVRRYLDSHLQGQDAVCDLSERERSQSPRGHALIGSCQLMGGSASGWSLDYGSLVELVVDVSVYARLSSLELGLALHCSKGIEVASSLSSDALQLTPLGPGAYRFRVCFPSLRLAPGQYYLGFGLRSDRGMEDYIREAVQFEVLPTEESARANVHLRKGAVVPELKCELLRRSDTPEERQPKSEVSPCSV